MTTSSREFIRLLEPIAATIFFAPEAHAEWEGLGLTPYQGYVCSRSAAMGRVEPAVVTAAFYNFSPRLVEQSLTWDVAPPDAVLSARHRAAGAVTTRLLDGAPGGAVAEAAALLRPAVAAVRPEGRPLAAAHAALPWPEDAGTALWHAATVLREHRGDGHNAILASHNIDGCEALALDSAFAGRPEPYYDYRAWDDAERRAATARLVARGYLDADGVLTDGGAKFREMIEMETDRLAWPPYEAVDAEDRNRALGLLRPLAEMVAERRGVPRFIAALVG